MPCVGLKYSRDRQSSADQGPRLAATGLRRVWSPVHDLRRGVRCCLVRKRSGRLEPFSPQKLHRGWKPLSLIAGFLRRLPNCSMMSRRLPPPKVARCRRDHWALVLDGLRVLARSLPPVRLGIQGLSRADDFGREWLRWKVSQPAIEQGRRDPASLGAGVVKQP